jgi:phosphoadenosine phosphosulfate reductase
MPREALVEAGRDWPDPLAYEGWPAEAILGVALARDFRGRIALVSSFGAESVVLLHMVAQIDRATPVLFGQTQMLFPETIAYQAEVAALLGLTDVRHMTPDASDVAGLDPEGLLHRYDPDACCALRKVAPLARTLAPFDAWINGRKRGQSATRAGLGVVERDADGRVKINPLADWSREDIAAYMDRHDLPRHPLVAKGYPSIGCAPCTTPVAPGEDPRAGRWRGRQKDECGIHMVEGRVLRIPGDSAPMDKF